MSSKTTPVMAWSTSVDNSMSADKAQIRNEEDQRLQVHAERNSSFLYLLTEWAENTSWGGIPYIVKKSNYLFKAMWLALVLGGLAITGFQTWQVFDRFFKYPVNINVNITYSSKLTFPSVTICNLNVIKSSGFFILPPEAFVLLGTFFGNTSSVTSAERLRTHELFQQVYNSMDYGIRLSASHRKTDMILDCVFNGEICTAADFLEWNDPVLGNCFSFNSGYQLNPVTYEFERVAPLHTYRTGPNYGLAVELYIEQEEYVGQLTDAAGAKVVIHHQANAPFPADQGIFLQPATFSSITLQKTNISRLPYPYPSNCVTVNNKEEAQQLDAFVEYFRTDYDLSGCLKSCYQSHVIKDCGCGDPKLPINTIATRNYAANKTATYEPCNNLTTLACQHNISQQFADDLLDCDHCRVACSSLIYSNTLSAAKWPNDAFMQTKLDHVASISPGFAKYRENATSPENNILKFNIHFEELNYEVIYESPAFTSDSIYGDIGGVIGLWLGMSFIAVFELIQLMMDAVVLGVTVLSTKTKRRKEDRK